MCLLGKFAEPYILNFLFFLLLKITFLFQCQRHQMILTNGQRAGFFIGDAAGVGKGRQVLF